MADDGDGSDRRLDELPPGALGRYARTGPSARRVVRLGQLVLCLALVAALLAATTGEWLQLSTVLLALLLNLALQQLFVLLNRRS